MTEKQEYVKINFFDYFRDCFVSVSPDFRKQILETARCKIGSWRLLSKELGAASRHVVANWKNHEAYNKRRMRFKNLVKCCCLSEIPEKELVKNIDVATMRYPAGDISISSWQLALDESFADWMGMLEGDGSVTDREVKFTNTYFDLVFHFSKFLEKAFHIERKRIMMVINYYTDDSYEKAKQIEADISKKGYKTRIYRTYNHKGNKIILTARVNFRVLSQFLISLKKDLHNLLKASPNSVKAAYVAGFSSAEGCASESKSGVRIITISQNSVPKLEFIKSLLKDNGVNNIHGPRFSGTAYALGITTQRNLEKFSQAIGFGKHEEKNRKLKEMISHYKFSVYRKGS